MKWISPPTEDADAGLLEKRLWSAADQFRANSGLTAQRYSIKKMTHPAEMQESWCRGEQSTVDLRLAGLGGLATLRR